MATVYRKVGGRKIAKIIALHEDVQDELDRRAFEIGIRAEELLIAHRQDGDAQINVEQGDVDRYVVLDDTRGLDAALSIEFGRAGYIDPETGNTVGAMEPLYILTQAANLPEKGKRMPSLKPYERKAKKKKQKKRREKK
jgi:hypothetical protein